MHWVIQNKIEPHKSRLSFPGILWEQCCKNINKRSAKRKDQSPFELGEEKWLEMSKVDSFAKREPKSSELMSIGISAFLKQQTLKPLELPPKSTTLLWWSVFKWQKLQRKAEKLPAEHMKQSNNIKDPLKQKQNCSLWRKQWKCNMDRKLSKLILQCLIQ